MSITHKITHTMSEVGECFLDNTGHLAKEVRHKAKKAYRAVTITNAKAECEDYIKRYLKNGKNDYLSLIQGAYKDCSSEDKSKIVGDLQKRVEKLTKDIEELNKEDKTTQYCLFMKRVSKADKIRNLTCDKELISKVLENFSSQKTLRVG